MRLLRMYNACHPSGTWLKTDVLSALKRWAKVFCAFGECRYHQYTASNVVGFGIIVALLTVAPSAHAQSLDEVLSRASQQVSSFVEQFSEVKCTEHVVQEKFAESNKIERRTESTYDYLVILSNSGGELSLDMSRKGCVAGSISRRPTRSRRHDVDLAHCAKVDNGFARKRALSFRF